MGGVIIYIDNASAFRNADPERFSNQNQKD
jgi:hypothetical protein